MGKITFSIPDELERDLRVFLGERYGDTRGALSTFLIDAIREKLEKEKAAR